MKRVLLPLILLLTPCWILAEAPVKVGATITLTSFGAFWGESQQRGMELALSKVNAAGGINGRPLAIVYEDIGAVDLKRAASGAQRLLSVDKVALLMPQWAEDTEVVWPIAAKANILTLAASAGHKSEHRFLFNVAPSYRGVIDSAVKSLDKSKTQFACGLVNQSTFFMNMGDALQKSATTVLGRAPFLIEYNGQDDDFRTALLKFKKEGCQALFLLVFKERLEPLLKQIKALGISMRLFFVGGIGGEEGIRAFAENAEGLISADIAVPSGSFKNEFSAKYAAKPDLPAAYGHDSILIAAEALRRAKSFAAEDVRAALLSVNGFQGATGLVVFNETGDRLGGETDLRVVRQGKLVELP